MLVCHSTSEIIHVAKMIRITILGSLLFCILVYADTSDETELEINYLVNYIETSKCVFNRNGVDYRGDEALVHVLRKRDYFKDDIKTAEDFIVLSATKSEMSGKKYTLKCGDEGAQELGLWLLNELKRYRESK